MRIAFCTVDWGQVDLNVYKLGGSGWARVGLPEYCLRTFGNYETGLFKRWGFNTKTLRFVMQDVTGRDIPGDWDVIVFQRWMHKRGAELIRAAKRSGQVIINDLDDWYWGLSQSNQAFVTSHPKFNPDENRNHYWKTMGESDIVTCSTRFLTDKIRARPGKAKVVHLPNMIDLSLYEQRPVKNTRRPTIGWVGGVPWRSGDLETLRGVLDPFLVQHGLRFYHGGHLPQRPANTMLGIPESRWFHRDMCAIEDYPQLFEPMDVGIAPLNELPFNYAKSAIKCLEYSAAGVPYIAQRLSEYSEYNDYLPQNTVKNAKQWLAALRLLLDPTERRKRQALQYERVQDEDIHVRWHDWEKVINQTVKIRTERAQAVPAEQAKVTAELERMGLDFSQVAADVAAEAEQMPTNATTILGHHIDYQEQVHKAERQYLAVTGGAKR